MVLKSELNKLFFKQKGLLIIILFLILEGVFCFVNIKNDDGFLSEFDKKNYSEYMNYLDGKMTADKETFILNENKTLEKAKMKYENIVDGFYSRKIDEEEYLVRSKSVLKELKRADAFSKIWSQYKFVKLSPENRYFIDDNISFLSNDAIDYAMVVLIGVLVLNFLFIEKDTEMIDFIKISKNGGVLTALVKWGIVMIFTISLVLSVDLIEYIAVRIFLGTDFLNYPIQSIEFFQNSIYQITIGQFWLYRTILKALGYAGFVSIIVILSEITRNKLFTIFIPTAILFFQELLFENKTWIYKVPFPTNLIRSSGYFRGDAEVIKSKGSVTEHAKKLFDSIAIEYLIAMILFCLLMIILALVIISISYRNKRKNFKIGIIFCVMIVSLSGCASGKNIKANEYNLNMNKNLLVNQNDDVYITKEGQTLDICYKDFSQKFELDRDPFLKFDRDKYIDKVFLDDDRCYINCARRGIDIRYIDLKDFSEKKLYEERGDKTDYFLNLYKDYSFDRDEVNIWSFFVRDNYFYIICHDGRLIKINIKNGDKKKILEDGVFNGNMAFDGKKIVYINDELTLRSYDLDTEKYSDVFDQKITCFYLSTDNIIYFDQEGLYISDRDGGNQRLIISGAIEEISCDDDYVYYTRVNDLKLYKLPKNGGTEQVICDEEVVRFEVLSNSNYVYCQINDNGKQRYKLVSK